MGMSVLTYFQIFASFWCSTILFFAPNSITYRQYALIVSLLSVAVVIRQMLKRSFHLNFKHFIIVIVVMIVCGLYYFTRFLYGGIQVLYSSYFLVLLGQVLPIVAIAPFVSESEIPSIRIKQLAPIVSIIFSLIAFVGTFNPSGTTTGGYALNDNGLNYQTVSYLAAYAAGLAEYYLICKNDMKWLALFNLPFMGIVMSFIVLINALSILISGGRGGLVVFVAELFVSLAIWIKKNTVSSQSLLKILFVILLVFLAAFFSFRFANKANIATSGFERVINTFLYGDRSGRSFIQKMSFESFLKSPIFGHGFGSVFYEINGHSHNFFFDVLLETGIVGLIIWISMFLYTIRRLVLFAKNDITDSLWLFFFLDGFIMSLFSGYYLAQLPLFWVITFVLCKKTESKSEQDNDNKKNRNIISGVMM